MQFHKSIIAFFVTLSLSAALIGEVQANCRGRIAILFFLLIPSSSTTFAAPIYENASYRSLTQTRTPSLNVSTRSALPTQTRERFEAEISRIELTRQEILEFNGISITSNLHKAYRYDSPWVTFSDSRDFEILSSDESKLYSNYFGQVLTLYDETPRVGLYSYTILDFSAGAAGAVITRYIWVQREEIKEDRRQTYIPEPQTLTTLAFISGLGMGRLRRHPLH